LDNPSSRAEAGFDPEGLDSYRKAVEGMLPPIDVGDALLGKAVQTVSVVGERLKVTYRVLTSGHRLNVLTAIQSRFGSSTIASPESSLYQQILTLACTIQKVQEASLVDPMKDGAFDEKILEHNAAMIRRLPDNIFWKVWFNYVWFYDRVIKAVDEGSLKNG
jgi:hypothetical protein